MRRRRKTNRDQVLEPIQPGMEVEATRGDLGEEDVSKPRVADVVADDEGNVQKLLVEKGVVFKKKLEIPADRVQTVENDAGKQAEGKVVVQMSEEETKDLKAVGEEELSPEAELGLLDRTEQHIPTHEGQRELEALNDQAMNGPPSTRRHVDEQRVPEQSPVKRVLRTLGPGFLSGMAGNDSSAVTAYAVNGASVGFSQLWLMLLSTPLYQAIQFACAKIGRVTQQNFSSILRERYSPWVAVLVSFVLIASNVALIAADLVAIGSGLELITHLSWVWFIVPVAGLLWYITVYRNFETLKKIFMVMSLVFVAYIVTALFSHAQWGAVLLNTFVPHIGLSFTFVSSAVALLGATFSPYSMFWQVQGEKEQKRVGSRQHQLRLAAQDIASGVISGNVVAYFIIVCTAATIFARHGQITTASDAAKALQPLLGPFAEYLFALGLIGSGLIAIPVLLASTSYAVAGTFGWPAGLSKKPWQNEGFYLILTLALVLSLVLALLHFDPVQLIFWANVLAGILAPVLMISILLVGNNRSIMQNETLGKLTNIGLALATLVSIAAVVLLFFGLVMGSG